MNIPTIGKITPYEYQWQICEAIKSHIRNEWANYKSTRLVRPAIVEAYVSAGKTIILGAIANHCVNVGAKVLILARIGELAEQDSDECWNMDTPNSIYSASLDRKSTHYNCVVGTERTVANALTTDFADWVPHVILIDECHEVSWRDVIGEATTSYGQIINHFRAKNPKLAAIGVTGTPYRGIESIVGPFWQAQLEPRIDRKFLVDNGYIVPTIFGFGHDDVQYDLGEFGPKSELGTEDYSSSELQAMAEKMDVSTTHRIMTEVIEIAKDRNSVMITCASENHCKEASEVLPAGTWGIVTQSTKKLDRKRILDGLKDGSIKYVLQIGCLTTGLNRPLLDTSVILRRIGSLTLLVQLLGRGMRLLKPGHVDAGIVKNDHLCLDYSGTMEAMQAMFDDPILEQAELDRAKKEKQLIECPKCATLNSEHARRCMGEDDGERCDYFWQSKDCPHCGVQNDTTARDCRECGKTLIDPNEALRGKHYTEDDWKHVAGMDFIPCKNGGILVIIRFDNLDHEGKPEEAKLFFNPWSSAGAKQIWKQTFVVRFVTGYAMQNKILGLRTNEAVCKLKAIFNVPSMATHRINEKGRSVVHGLKFLSGKTTMGGKVVNGD